MSLAYLQSATHLAQLGLGSIALYHAYIAITNLQENEEATEKAAKYSNIAEERLHKTRTTQTSGTLALLSSFASAAYCLFNDWTGPSVLTIVYRVALVIALYSSKAHQDNFWSDKARVPLATTYNSGQRSTQVTRRYLGYLGLTWGLSAIVESIRLVGR